MNQPYFYMGVDHGVAIIIIALIIFSLIFLFGMFLFVTTMPAQLNYLFG